MNVAALVQTAMAAVPDSLKAAVTFTRTTQSSDEATGQMTPTVTTITGTASRGRGDPTRYARLSLVESQSPTLIFVPDTEGAAPGLGDVVVWAGEKFVVADADPIAPGGTAFASSLVITR